MVSDVDQRHGCSTNSLDEFTEVERFDQVVDGADPKPIDLIGNLVMGRQPSEGVGISATPVRCVSHNLRVCRNTLVAVRKRYYGFARLAAACVAYRFVGFFARSDA